MVDVPVRVALVRTFRDWPRHAGTLAFVLATVAAAAYLGTTTAYFAAGLIVFSTWMIWFVATGVSFLRILGA